jgi:asparagine synthase (glutamine-hydrolysing)
MNSMLRHRGPDNSGEFEAENVLFAMRRLSIIDVSGGAQPIYNETGSLAVICNGEIYNYVELTTELKKHGHQFRSNSDVETIVHLYEEHGVDCVQHLRGMFAFALWDNQKRRLLLARDRIGEKPLYLQQDNHSLYFASEMKALLSAAPKIPELDPIALDLFFHYQYVPEPRTAFKDIRKLPAAHRLIVDVESWSIHEECYWNPLDAPALTGNPAELIRNELETVSRIVVRSDVPVGIALSGGLDSGAIALLTAPAYPETMRAFSVGYPGNLPNDERPQARMLAQQLGVPFYDVELKTEELVEFFPQLMLASDDPVADIAAFPQYAVMRRAAEHGVKVMLNGLGGDELFWGYQWVREAAQRTANRWKARGIQRLLTNWNRVPDNQLTFYDLEGGFKAFEPWETRLYTPGFRNGLPANNAFAPFIVPDASAPVPLLITRAIFDTWLLGNCIALGDRLSMASSVELRLPLVDYRLVEVVFGLRKCHEDHLLPPKTWLKSALTDILPAEMLNRPKQGFSPPSLEWIAALIKQRRDSIHQGVLVSTGMIDREAAARLLTNFNNGGWNWVSAYKLLVFETWYEAITAQHAQPA